MQRMKKLIPTLTDDARCKKSATFYRISNKCVPLMIVLLMLVTGCDTKDENASVSGKDNPETVSLSEEAQKSQTIEQEGIKATFVELGSDKCIQCKMMQPIIEEIEKEYKDQVKVVFHDVWTKEGNPYAIKYKIRVIPTQIFLDKGGKEYFRHEGFFPKEELVKILEMQGVEL